MAELEVKLGVPRHRSRENAFLYKSSRRRKRLEYGLVTVVHPEKVYDVQVSNREHPYTRLHPSSRESIFHVGDMVTIGFGWDNPQLPFILCKGNWLSTGSLVAPEEPQEAPEVVIIWPSRLGLDGSGRVPEKSQGEGIEEADPPYATLATLDSWTRIRHLRSTPDALYFLRLEGGDWYLNRWAGEEQDELELTVADSNGFALQELTLLELDGGEIAAAVVEDLNTSESNTPRVTLANPDLTEAWSTPMDEAAEGAPFARPFVRDDSLWVPTRVIATPFGLAALGMAELDLATGEVLSSHLVEWATLGSSHPPPETTAGLVVGHDPLVDYDCMHFGNRVPVEAPGDTFSYTLDQVIVYEGKLLPRVRSGEQLILWDPVEQERVAEVDGMALMTGASGTSRRYSPITLVGEQQDRNRLLSAYEQNVYEEVSFSEVDTGQLSFAQSTHAFYAGRVFADSDNIALLQSISGESPEDMGFEFPESDPEGFVASIVANIAGYMAAAVSGASAETLSYLTNNLIGWELREMPSLELLLDKPYNEVESETEESFPSGSPTLVAGAAPPDTHVRAAVGHGWVRIKVTYLTTEAEYYAYHPTVIFYGSWPSGTTFEIIDSDGDVQTIYYTRQTKTFTHRKYPPHSALSGCYSHRDKLMFLGPGKRLQAQSPDGETTVVIPVPGPVETLAGVDMPEDWNNDNTNALAWAALNTNTLEFEWCCQYAPAPWQNHDPNQQVLFGYEMTSIDVGESRGFLANLKMLPGPDTEVNYSRMLRVDKDGSLLEDHPFQAPPFSVTTTDGGENMPYQGGHLYVVEDATPGTTCNLRRLEE